MYNTDAHKLQKHFLLKHLFESDLGKSNITLYLCVYVFILKLTYINWLLYDNA